MSRYWAENEPKRRNNTSELSIKLPPNNLPPRKIKKSFNKDISGHKRDASPRKARVVQQLLSVHTSYVRREANVKWHIPTTEIENNKENKRGNVHEGGLLSFNLVPTRGGQVIFFRKKPPKRLSG